MAKAINAMHCIQLLPNRNFEAMGAQLISGVQQILMVLGAQGAQNHEMY